MSTVKTYNVDSGDTTNLVLKTNGTTAVTVNGTTQAVTVAGALSVDGNTTLGNAAGDSLTITAGTITASNAGAISTSVGSLYPLISGTAQASTSGTSIDFTGIPSWAKRITVMFNGVSTSGTSVPLVQIGDSGGVENTGYVGVVDSNAVAAASSTAGWSLFRANAATSVYSGTATLNYLGSNTWVISTNICNTTDNQSGFTSGTKTLSGTLDRIRITTVNGTDTFDAGTINILYE